MPDRLRAVLVRRRPAAPVRYGAATLAVAFTALVQLSLFSSAAPWFLYTPVVVFVTLLLGSGAGLWATALAAAAAGYVVVRPGLPTLMLPVHWAASVIFTLTTIGLVGLVQVLRVALKEADALRRARDADLAETARREAFLASVLSASTDCIKVVELDGSLSFMSEGGMRVMEVSSFNDVAGCPWSDFMKDGGVGLARDAIEAARLGRTTHFETDADTFSGTPKHWSVSVSPILASDGAVSRILSVSRDHTALAHAREQQRLLNGELGHRLKNVLSVVQSVANQTLRQADTLDAAAEALSSRLASLGRATEVLTATSWRQADLHAVAKAGLTAVSGMEDRVTVSGPPLLLNPQAAMALTLALHELTTNATKYGALTGGTGDVTLEWRTEGTGEDERLLLLWRERGGPPVSPPTRRGFGSRMIGRALRSYFRGDVALAFPPEGVEFRIDAPLDAAVPAGGR